MWFTELLTTVLAFATFVAGSPFPQKLYRRYAYDATVSDSYDFVIVGGGVYCTLL
jgi:hypothetical protein